MKFKEITLQDKELIDEFTKEVKTSFYRFASLFIWKEVFKYRYAVINEQLCITGSFEGKTYAFFPLGKGDKGPVIEKLYSVFGSELIIGPMNKEMKSELENTGICGVFKQNRNQSEYIYSRKSLAELSGKTLHAKRNFINRFVQAFEWTYRPMTKPVLKECAEALENWFPVLTPEDDLYWEHRAIGRIADEFERLNLLGGAVYIGEKPVAFTLAEKVGDTAVVHTEKADKNVPGAYPMINHEFVRRELEDVEYVNREEDLGIEGLRKAKLSYKPEFLTEIFTFKKM